MLHALNTNAAHTNDAARTVDPILVTFSPVEFIVTGGTIYLMKLKIPWAMTITNAKIMDLSVGKLTAGTITAIMLMAGMLRSGTTGLRYELDTNGLRFYDANNNLAINLDRTTGSATITGDFKTSTNTDSITLSNSTGDPLITFKRNISGLDACYITAIGNASNSTIDLHLTSGPNNTFNPKRETRIELAPDEARVAYADVADGYYRGGLLKIGQSTASLTIRNSNASGALDGGSVSIDSSAVDLVLSKAGAVRSELLLQDGLVTLSAMNTGGATVATLTMGGAQARLDTGATNLIVQGAALTLVSNDRIRFRGWFGSFIDHAIGFDEAISIAEFFVSGGLIPPQVSFTYGPTMLSIMIPIVTVDGPLCRWGSTNNTTTGFQVQFDGPDGHYVRAAIFRK